jgi:hypothetical protein
MDNDIREAAARAAREWTERQPYQQPQPVQAFKELAYESGYLAGYEAAKAEAVDIREELIGLRDRLVNGIMEDGKGQYVLIWTKRDLDLAAKRADELGKMFADVQGDEHD